MDNPELTQELIDDEKTIVNIKGVSKSAWERARQAANRSGESMGDWISRAANQLANLEAGQRFFEPDKLEDKPAKPQLPAVDFREIAAVLVAMKEAGLPTQKRVGQELNALLHGHLKAHRPAKDQRHVTIEGERTDMRQLTGLAEGLAAK
jgi:hypothetical protein